MEETKLKTPNLDYAAALLKKLISPLATADPCADDFRRLNERILVCLVLHNIMIRFNDEWEDDVVPEDNVDDADPFEVNFNVPAQSLRNRVQNHLLNWYYNLL